ncbi:hypothetical protein EPUS_03298 [Endocarpon pusillum Z07020]|uniref:Zinc-regulated transporter 2 n=1 Tax=Endocarpon pusillum (strain Z07020 / HMAS-L-300199) TaxID=1263415 RepID=U1GFX4_ENDPU|nr:uncharacterized protein EPUS_03298 [Endocarpon pusillum Z07020]ERF71018.1 hypothetical protein EPUS_03298 [Endocarpon pusillum Z07020]
MFNKRGYGDNGVLYQLSSQALRTELQRRDEATGKPVCGSGGRTGSYNTPLHVAALFIILILSTLACSFPIIARRFPKLPIPHRFLFLSRHFGTGVLIATAFVHLLPTAFVSLTDPCLPYFWNEGYPAMAGFIAMASVFLVVTIEMFFAMRGAKHMHGSEWDTLPPEDGETQQRHRTLDIPLADSVDGHQKQPRNGGLGLHGRSGSHQGLMEGQSTSNTPNPNTAADESESDLDILDPIAEESISLHEPSSRHQQHRHNPQDQHSANPQKLLLQCLLLEAGILFHSIFIGMALSVSTGTPFVVLLVAISFHQTFEGLALGSRISALIPSLFGPRSIKPWLMALAYGTTTPIGQAIGLGMHKLYDPASMMGLLSVGITNAISSGLLLFAGLVELLAEDFLSDRSYEVLRGRRRMEACLSVAAGGILMAIVGAFA